ncbi:MAG: hypothetical protein WB789_09795 [Thermoplasmata archaeon]
MTPSDPRGKRVHPWLGRRGAVRSVALLGSLRNGRAVLSFRALERGILHPELVIPTTRDPLKSERQEFL